MASASACTGRKHAPAEPIGGAAHAMTPTLGRGACQALEDTVVLAKVLDGGLDAYDRLRRRAPR